MDTIGWPSYETFPSGMRLWSIMTSCHKNSLFPFPAGLINTVWGLAPPSHELNAMEGRANQSEAPQKQNDLCLLSKAANSSHANRLCQRSWKCHWLTFAWNVYRQIRVVFRREWSYFFSSLDRLPFPVNLLLFANTVASDRQMQGYFNSRRVTKWWKLQRNYQEAE